MEPVSICTICLRTNKKLKIIDTVLSEYHNKITNYSLQLLKPLCCSECEHQLRKTYNFHQKCLKATEILKTWLTSTVTEKFMGTTVHMLHTKLPQTNLAMWTQKNNKVYNFVCIDKENPTIVIDDTNLDDDSSDEFPDVPLKYKIVSKDSKNIFLNDNTKPIPETSGTSNILKKETNIKIQTCKTEGANKKLFIEIVPNINDILKKKDNENIKANLIGLPKVSKVKSENESFNASKSNNQEDDDVICLDDDEDVKIDLIDNDEENNYPDDASLNSADDCDDYLYSPEKKRHKRMTLDELAGVELEAEDLAEDFVYSRETIGSASFSSSVNKFIAVQMEIDSKIDTINANLNSICENWEVTSLTNLDVPNVSKDEIKTFIRKFLTDREVANEIRPGRSEKLKKIKNKVLNMKSNLNLINEECERVLKNYTDGLLQPKEKLRAELSLRIKKWGQLKSDSGRVFDFDVIVSCLDMTPRGMICRLLKYLQNTRKSKRLIPGIAKFLTMIESKQQLEKYKSVFDIENMTTEKEAMEEFERRKTYECYVKADYKCDVCFQVFRFAGMLEYHKKYHTKSKGPIRCNMCNINFSSKRRYQTHKTSHEVVYKCKLCPLVTYYFASMRNHYEQHKGTAYKCDKCDMTYKSKSVLNSHRYRAHLSDGHACTICGGVFLSAAGLRTHKFKKNCGASAAAEAGDALDEVKCDMCDLTFASPQAYHKHQLRLHRAIATRPTFNRTINPNKKRAVRKRPNMVCKVCNKVGHSYGWMVLHFGTEHPTLDVTSENYGDRRTHLCDVCGKGFMTIYTLRNHISIHHSGMTYPCPKCGKRFPSKQALRYHHYFHGPRKFACDKCGKKFRSPSNLYNHIRSHVRNRPFKCNICGKAFIFRSTIKEHIKGVHNHERRVRKRATKRSRSIEETADYSTRESNMDATNGDIVLGGVGDPMYLELGEEIADAGVENYVELS